MEGEAQQQKLGKEKDSIKDCGDNIKVNVAMDVSRLGKKWTKGSGGRSKKNIVEKVWGK